MTETYTLSDDPEDNFDLFLANAIDTGCVWALENSEGFALCPSVDNEELDVMPLWSQPEFAEVHRKEEWEEFKVVPIALEELLDEWLPGMHSDLTLVGINWTEALEGMEIEPLDLLEEIDREAQS